jgi:hypothetical protein
MDYYYVSLHSTPMPWPLSLAVHLWFVIEHGGIKERVEVWAPVYVIEDTTVIVDALPPYMGFRRSYFDSVENPKRVGLVRKIAEYSGNGESVAAKLYAKIKAAREEYPYKNQYKMWPGPNSNTFVAWVVAGMPELEKQLPSNAFGKNYKLPKIS